jgi:uncharacterized protein HemX
MSIFTPPTKRPPEPSFAEGLAGCLALLILLGLFGFAGWHWWQDRQRAKAEEEMMRFEMRQQMPHPMMDQRNQEMFRRNAEQLQEAAGQRLQQQK